MSRRDAVAALLPLAPPCFASRLDWLEYSVSVAEAQSEKGQPAALIFDAGKPVRFNHNLDFCHDCDPQHALERHLQGRCKPDALRTQAKPLLQLVREFLGQPQRDEPPFQRSASGGAL